MRSSTDHLPIAERHLEATEAAKTAEDLSVILPSAEKERKKTDNPREGWEDGTPPPHRDFKERGVVH